MNKRGVEMSLQVIVVAVIVLLIAAVLIYMVLNTARGTNKTLGDCKSKGGLCAYSGDCNPGEQPYYLADCGEGGVCCISTKNINDVLG